MRRAALAGVSLLVSPDFSWGDLVDDILAQSHLFIWDVVLLLLEVGSHIGGPHILLETPYFNLILITSLAVFVSIDVSNGSPWSIYRLGFCLPGFEVIFKFENLTHLRKRTTLLDIQVVDL